MNKNNESKNGLPAFEEGGRLVSTTLGELGPVLPLGFSEPGTQSLKRDLVLRRWTGRTMRELGKMREESREIGMPEHVGLVLRILAEKIGPLEFQSLKPNEQKAVISQMWMGDVFYAYIYARVQSLGPELVVDLTCPNCRNEFKFVADLNALTVTTAKCLEDTYWIYTLEDPIVIRGKEVEQLAMGPAHWDAVATAQVAGQHDVEAGKLAVAAGSIRGIAGREQFPLMQNEIDDLTGRDIEGIVARVDEHFVGPDMRIVTRCPGERCKGPISVPIDWSYTRFFSGSSRYLPDGKSSTSSSQPATSPREELSGI